MGSVERGLRFSLPCLRLPDVGGQLFRTLKQRRTVLGAGRTDALAGRLLLGAQCVGRRDRRPAVGICVEQHIHEPGILTAAELRPAHPVRILAREFQVDHAVNPTFG